MKATLIAWTTFDEEAATAATDGQWTHPKLGQGRGGRGGELLTEFAGRACYESWDRPNPATATNAGYIKHIIDVGHGSVLEHASATFYLTEVSRAFSHELVRHRHLSFSQLSQRFANQYDSSAIMSDVVWGDEKAYAIHAGMALAARDAYKQLMTILEEKYAHVANKTRRRKLAREQARRVLLESTETKIVVTGNFRAWRHFIDMRATEHADLEIAEVAVDILRQLQAHAPNVFGDYTIVKGEFGEYAVKS